MEHNRIALQKLKQMLRGLGLSFWAQGMTPENSYSLLSDIFRSMCITRARIF